MKRPLTLSLTLLIAVFSIPSTFAHSRSSPGNTTLIMTGGTYTLVVEGYDWGAGVSKVILNMNEAVSEADPGGYTVSVARSSDCVEITGDEASGERTVINAYVSDEKGDYLENGTHVTLVLFVSPLVPLTSPFKYVRNGKCSGNIWVDYRLTITDRKDTRVWDTETGRITPIVDRFDLSGKYETDGGLAMSYASYTPVNRKGKAPLIIWLHGGGEGGTDPSVPLLANRAANYASKEIQAIFRGAYVLVPQCPGAWMHNAEGVMTHGAEEDVYHVGLMELIRNFVKEHPDIDPGRIYVGGCSNGGYMSLKLILDHPGYFAAGFISSLAFQSRYISDDQIESIRKVPIWFVHSADDQTTIPDQTVLPVYRRLIAAGAENVHLSYYNHVVDITGFYGGEGLRYPGHWSWVYCHANLCRQDFDGSLVEVNGRPATIMEWLAAQSLNK